MSWLNDVYTQIEKRRPTRRVIVYVETEALPKVAESHAHWKSNTAKTVKK